MISTFEYCITCSQLALRGVPATFEMTYYLRGLYHGSPSGICHQFEHCIPVSPATPILYPRLDQVKGAIKSESGIIYDAMTLIAQPKV